jgi:Sec-independent protein translocase protein TatA
MEIFGIGPLELILIVLIAIVVLGPKEMMTTARKAADGLRKLRNSEIWSTTKEMMDIPNQVMKETGLDKEIREIKNLSSKTFSPPTWEPAEQKIGNSQKAAETEKVVDATDSLPVTPEGKPDEANSNDRP